MQICGSYHMGFSMTAEGFRKHVDAMADLVGPWLFQNPNVTHLVGRGISGQLLVWPLAYKLKMDALIIRKPNEDAHGKSNVGFGDMRDYAVVDDFVAEGNTIRAVEEGIAAMDRGGRDWRYRSEMKAIFLYNQRRNVPFDNWPGVPVFGIAV